MKVKESGGGNFELPAPENYQAICYKIVNIGTIPEEFKGKTSLRAKVQFTWELPTEKTIFKEGDEPKPFVVNRIFTNSTDEKSHLSKFIILWANGKINKDNIKDFDMLKLLGKQCLLQIAHKASTKNPSNKFLEAAGISSLPKGMSPMKQTNENFIFDVEEFDQEKFNTLPEFIRKMVVSSEEFKALKLDPEKVLALAGTKKDTANETSNDSGIDAEIADDQTDF